ncbi:MAG: Phosphoribosylformylglycinamidine synthase PurS protein [Candidatus Tokpelaia hoelldobleri]|uniref:Phosphoribosylformylglycinamidine synthase subunit PurS n=1 Tax=Candidatus Tokpelaia hoelldobleri TaxID=1902579 RepID=A0A1U9JUY5_9HYPH|nr:MAG: Phosphoribosylformylglycinamidine synthase PurS protein [Candidatus Tokpelaia hoelldoblerii]
MKARITVTLKNAVLDPQGKAISGALESLDFKGVQSVRQGKIFDLVLAAQDQASARQQLEAMCEKLLANTVVENYHIDLVP